MRLLKLVLSIGLLAIASTGSASVLQCRSLFASNVNLIAEADIENKIEALAISYLQLDEVKPELRPQVIADINKELTSLAQVNENSIRLFKQKISELKDQITNSRKQKEKEDKVKRKDRVDVVESQNPIKLARKAVFHEIRPGKFKMGHAQVDTEITKPFAMMDTPMTQMMWARLQIAIGEKNLEKINPSYFKDGDNSLIVNIEGIHVEMQPDHPVEQVSHNDIKEFIVGLNKLSNSNDAKDQALLQNLMPGHQKGDVYDLSTEAQREFVMQDLGRMNKKWFDRDDSKDLPHYAWIFTNSDKQTHAVATKLPRMIDGQPFFDLEGNVTEWMKDLSGLLWGGVDPQGGTMGEYYVTRGGHWRAHAIHASLLYRDTSKQDYRGNSIGFRLVRSRP